MKNSIGSLVVVLALMVAGCGKGGSSQGSGSSDTTAADSGTAQVARVKVCPDSLGRTVPELLDEFVRVNSGLPQSTRDSAFAKLWGLWNSMSGACTLDSSIVAGLHSSDSGVASATQTSLAEAGFDWVSIEGEALPLPNARLALKVAGGLLSAPARRYLELNDLRAYPQAFIDFYMVLDCNELADRVFLWADSTLHQPGFAFADDAERDVAIYLSTLFAGTEGTPSLERGENGKLSATDEYLKAYEYVEQRYAGHPLAAVVAEYRQTVTAPDFDYPRDMPPLKQKYPRYVLLDDNLMDKGESAGEGE